MHLPHPPESHPCIQAQQPSSSRQPSLLQHPIWQQPQSQQGIVIAVMANTSSSKAPQAKPLLTKLQPPLEWVLDYPHCTDEKTETQGGWVRKRRPGLPGPRPALGLSARYVTVKGNLPCVCSDSGPGSAALTSSFLQPLSGAAPTPGSPKDRLRLQEGLSRPPAMSLHGPRRGRGTLTVLHGQHRGTDWDPTRSRGHDPLTASQPPGIMASCPGQCRRQGWDQVGPSVPALRGERSTCSPHLPIPTPLSMHRASSTKSPTARGSPWSLPL